MSSTSIAVDSPTPTRRAPAAARTPLLIAALFVLLHVLLAATIDAADPDAFLRADRAVERLQTMEGMLATTSSAELVHYLATHGVIGDYAAHGLLYLLGGRFAVVFVQIALAALSGIAVYRLGLLLGLSGRMCAFAMTAYLCLPHTLVFPHQLATEALHVPLFVISNWLLAESMIKPRMGLLICSAVCLGAATLIRPITLLWPIVAAAAIAIAWRPRDAGIYVGIALLPVIAWMSFIGAQTGEPGLGRSGHSMERNLYERVVRISETLPPRERDAARAAYLDAPDRNLGAVDYLRFAVEYPAASLRHLLRDAVVFFAKSGVERITLDYLAVSPASKAVQSPRDGWRRQLELHGLVHTASYLWTKLGPALIVSLAGVAVMLTLTALALIGAVHFLRRWRDIRTPQVLLGLTLAAVVVYTFVFSQVLNAMQSRLRAPAEFALVLLAAVGLHAWRELRERRQRGSAAAHTVIAGR